PAAARTLANTLEPLEEIADTIEQVQGRCGFMSYVAEDAEVRAAADGLREALEKYEIELSYREDLYQAVQEFAATVEAKALEGEDKRLLERTLRDYRRAGFDLQPEQREKVKALFNKLVELGLVFQRNIDTYEDAIYITRKDLAGLPDAYIDNLRTEDREGQN